MRTREIIESGMTFGPYPEGHCFHIERSDSYAAVHEHIKVAEFLLLRPKKRLPVIFIVEAKSSSPHPETEPDFDEFIAGIREKFVNAFSLGWACCLGRHPETKAELPNEFKTLNLSQTQVRFVLVINGHREEWLPPLQDALSNVLRSTIKTWGFAPTSVAVLNETLARDNDFIRSPEKGSHESI